MQERLVEVEDEALAALVGGRHRRQQRALFAVRSDRDSDATEQVRILILLLPFVLAFVVRVVPVELPALGLRVFVPVPLPSSVRARDL